MRYFYSRSPANVKPTGSLGQAEAQAPLAADIDEESLVCLPLLQPGDDRRGPVSRDTFAKAEAQFGKRGTVELVALMGDYALVGLLCGAVDQHLPEGKTSLPDVDKAAMLH
jgi:hypothetical protein